MEKKIIAVVSILVIMLSVFSACAKKIYTRSINGEEYAVVTDENGELITNSFGRIAMYVTNEDGKLVTDPDKEPVVNYFEVATDVIAGDGNIVKNGFRINIPDGWKADDASGRVYKDKTDSKCYIEVVKAYEEDKEASDSDETASFRSYVDQMTLYNKELIGKINSGEADDDKISDAKMTEKKLDKLPEGITDSAVIQYIMYDKDGNVVHYAENIYLESEDKVIYELVYVNVDGVGYNPDFDFEKWSGENIIKLS
ncbi:MAG: hypothetical protein K5761_02275 [Clostridiales bacterium]|nr:hypothetical protein [Clostridiales bacterium]